MTNLQSKVLRAVIYIRVSTAMQVLEGWSLAAQESALRDMAERLGYKVVAVFADEGKSARKRLKHRKAIFELLDFVEAGGADVIIFRDLDRWFRNVADFHLVQSRLDACGVIWKSELQPTLDMSTKEGRLLVNVLLSVGQTEADAASDRVKYTNKYLREQRRWNAGARTLPRCYTLDDDHHVIIDPEKEPYTRALISRFMACGSVRAALLEVNEEFNEDFLYNNCMRLLTNEMLCGEYKGDLGFVEKPLMSREEFFEMQRLLKRNARRHDRQLYIFSGMVFCGNCGVTMPGGATTKTVMKVGGPKTYKYYRCKGATVMGTCNHGRRINEEKLERDLLQYVRVAVANRIVEVRELHHLHAQKKPKKSNRAAIEKQLDKLEDLYITSDRMTKERYEEKRAAILSKLVEDTPEPEPPALVNLENIQAIFNSDIEEVYETYTDEQRRRFWRAILRTVTVLNNEIVDVDFVE